MVLSGTAEVSGSLYDWLDWAREEWAVCCGGDGSMPGPHDMLQLAYGDQRGYAGGYGGGGGGGAGYGYGYGPYGYGGGGGGGGAQRSYPGGGSQPPLPGEKTSGWGGMFASQDGEQHVVKMRGIPFKATEMEISEWFNEYATCQDTTCH